MSKHYLCINDFELDEFDVLGSEFHFNSAEVFKQDKYLVDLANMSDKEIKSLQKSLDLPMDDSTPQEYLDKAHNILVQALELSIANIIGLNLINTISQSPELAIPDAKKILCDSIEIACMFSKSYCNALTVITDPDTSVEKKAMTAAAIHMIRCDFRYLPVVAISKKTGEPTCCNCYAVSSTWDAIQLLFVLAFKSKNIISKCKVCGQYFIPTSKREEIYCPNCRNVSYDTKIKDDEIRSAYRTIYKTQNARKRRNSHIPTIEERFDNWGSFAKEKLNSCVRGDITVEEMKQMLSTDEWIRMK